MRPCLKTKGEVWEKIENSERKPSFTLKSKKGLPAAFRKRLSSEGKKYYLVLNLNLRES